MRRRLAPLLLAAALAAACAPAPAPVISRPVGPQVRVDDVLRLAATQVRRCYRAPRVSSEGRQIITRLRLRVSGDGRLAQLPVVVEQAGVNPRNRPYAGRMAEAAIEAVMRCTPLALPAGVPPDRLFGFDLTFSPLAPA